MQDIYNYTPETNHVPTLHNVAAVLLLQYMAHVMVFPTINPLYFTLVLPAVSVQCPVWVFCSVPGHRAFPVCCSGTVWVIFRGFQLPLLLLVSFCCFYNPRVQYLYRKAFICQNIVLIVTCCFIKLTEHIQLCFYNMNINSHKITVNTTIMNCVI
jgi:hypothetical protein